MEFEIGNWTFSTCADYAFDGIFSSLIDGDADGLMELRLPPGAVAATELSLRWTRAAVR